MVCTARFLQPGQVHSVLSDVKNGDGSTTISTALRITTNTLSEGIPYISPTVTAGLTNNGTPAMVRRPAFVGSGSNSPLLEPVDSFNEARSKASAGLATQALMGHRPLRRCTGLR